MHHEPTPPPRPAEPTGGSTPSTLHDGTWPMPGEMAVAPFPRPDAPPRGARPAGRGPVVAQPAAAGDGEVPRGASPVARVALSQRPIGRRMVAESLPVDAAAAPGGGRGRRETGRTLYRRALDMMRRKRNREALAAVRQALKLDRDRPEYLALCAWLLHLEQGAPAMREAMELVERAVRRAPRNTRALYYKGLLLERSDRGEEAQRCYGRVLELDPDDLDAARRLRLLGMRAGRQPQTRGLFARLRER